jgi:hypothetical protein
LFVPTIRMALIARNAAIVRDKVFFALTEFFMCKT